MNIKHKIISIIILCALISTGCRTQNKGPLEKCQKELMLNTCEIYGIENNKSPLENFYLRGIKRSYFPILFEGILNNKAIFRLRNSNDQNYHTLSAGDQLGGYTLIRRDQDKAIFELDKRTYIIHKNIPLIIVLKMTILNKVTKEIHRVALNQDFFNNGFKYKVVDIIDRQMIVYDYKTKELILVSQFPKKTK